MIQIKVLKDFNGMLKDHIYNFADNEETKKLVDTNCAIKWERDEHGKFIQVGIYEGTGDLAVYYSKDHDELHGTLAPKINIPQQLHEFKLLKVSDAKQPFEAAWQKSNNTINDKNFLDWIEGHEKYGVLCGANINSSKFLVVIDFDDEITQREVLENGILPETFTCKTARKGLYHLYFYSTEPIAKWKIMTKDKDTLADVQGTSTQVIGPGSRIPDGRTYSVVKDLPIAQVTATLLHKALDQFHFQKVEEVLQATADGLSLSDFEKSFGNDKALEQVRSELKIVDILRDASIPTNRNPTKCPFHSSKGGKCLGFDNNKGIWNCFHCMEHGTAIDLWMKINSVTDFVEAKKKLCEKFNIKDTYAVEKAKEKAEPVNNLPMVRLPSKNHTLPEFALEVAGHIKGTETMFYKPDEKTIVEIDRHYDKLLRREIVGFGAVDGKRLLNLIEEHVNTYNIEYVKKEEVMVRQDPNEQTIALLSRNTIFKEALYQIKRFLTFPMPFLDHTGELIVPRHAPNKGYYDDRFQAYFAPSTPELKLMSIAEAKSIIDDVLKEFCFKTEADRIMARAYIITPMCRGLYITPTTRTPLFIIQANRERAGKDYLAGVRGVLYEGQAIDDTPIVTGDKNESNSEELRKKFTAALKAGRRLYHSSNNRGFLNNAVLEQFTTSEVWRDRELGKSVQLELFNEVDISLSANLGLTYTPDLHHRSRPINLFYTQENPNERAFKRTDLHGYIRNNRGLVLSAIYTLINAWVIAGKPPGKTLFTSFPEWARVIGGIMHYADIGDPCISVEDTNIGGDRETLAMKELVGFMALYQDSDATHKMGYTTTELKNIVIDATSTDDMEGFTGWDLRDDKSTQTKFGMLIKRFVDREFHCRQQTKFKEKHGEDQYIYYKATMYVAKGHDRSNRILYSFKKDIEGDTVPILTREEHPKDSLDIVEESVVDLLPPVPKIDSMDIAYRMLQSIFADSADGKVYKGLLVDRGISEEFITEFINRGDLYEMGKGYVGLLK